jgi:iron complex outermembrane receptor protein
MKTLSVLQHLFTEKYIRCSKCTLKRSRKNHLKLLLFALSISFTNYSFSQDLTLSGTVSQDKMPIEGALVYAKSTTYSTTTNSEGDYKLEMPAGSYEVVFAFGNKKTVKLDLQESQTLNVDLAEAVESLDEISVKAFRVSAEAPITHSNLSKEELSKRNLGQDIATQINFLPSVVTTSDAGAGIGYTGFRVRGTANQGINVTINGIPYNDAESSTSFFVNLQDFTSSVENLQLQRGVGTSTNGPGAFGASLNILTDAVSTESYASISNSFGSFNTRRHNVKFSTGLMDNHIEVSGRLSQIKSDGYIDRASSDLKSYFLQAAYKDDNTLIKLINFAGSEVTYQSWFGVDRETAENNPTFNPAGQRFDENGNPDGFHPNQVDNYKQDHFQLHWNQKYNDNWTSSFSLNYTYGRGFFEEYIDNWLSQNINFDGESALSFYGLSDVTIGGETISTSDIVRRRWLDNDYYVASGNVNYKDDQWDIISGAFFSYYEGDHFGEVIWARFASDSETGQRYYDGVGKKTEFSAFAKANYKLNEKFLFYLDLQGRLINYETTGQNSSTNLFEVDESFEFFNPKLGLSYKMNSQNQFYASFARAYREPNRTDFENGSPRPERLDDYELGWRHNTDKLSLNINGFFMNYKDQLVLTGAIDNVGAPIRANSGRSYRLGVEIDADVKLNDKFSVVPNLALSENQNRDFVFQRDGVLQNLGNTEISYSPSIVAGNTFVYQPTDNFYAAFLSKYVGEQFLGNIESPVSKLDAFFTNDLNFVYTLKGIPSIKSIDFSLLVNNIFDVDYISNGYFFTFDDDFSVPDTTTTIEGAGFYPQAGINFLFGVTLMF